MHFLWHFERLVEVVIGRLAARTFFLVKHHRVLAVPAFVDVDAVLHVFLLNSMHLLQLLVLVLLLCDVIQLRRGCGCVLPSGLSDTVLLIAAVEFHLVHLQLLKLIDGMLQLLGPLLETSDLVCVQLLLGDVLVLVVLLFVYYQGWEVTILQDIVKDKLPALIHEYSLIIIIKLPNNFVILL